MKHLTPLEALPLLLVAICMTPADSRSSTFEGNWRYTQLIEDEQSSLNCRWFHVTTRRYNLQLDPLGRYIGGYLREYRVMLLGPAIHCPEHVRPDHAMKLYRSDLWYVAESDRSENQLSVLAEYDNCMGACSNDAPVSRQFSAFLTLEEGMLIDDLGGDEGQYVFIPESSALDAEQSAAARMFELVQPMYAGECNRFFENSLDPSMQRSVSKAQLCAVVQRLGKLMPPILFDEPSSTTFFTFGRFRREMTGGVPTEIWGGHDVLVERRFVGTPGGDHVPISAVLRRQPDDTWKVLVPTP